MDQLLFELYACISNNDCQLTTYSNGMAPREMTQAWLKHVDRCKEIVRNGLVELKPLMTKYFPEKMWEEFVDQRFKAKLEYNEYFRHLLSAASLKWDDRLKNE